MTQGKVSVLSKTIGGNPDVTAATAPPTYEEATTGPHYGGEGGMVEFGWNDANIRRVFIRKVYTILMIQLFITLAIVALFTFSDPVKIYVQTNPVWYWLSHVSFFVTYMMLFCCTSLRRQFPWNLILLAVFTLSMSIMMAFVSSFHNTKSVMICVCITALVCLTVTVISFQTKVDITSFQGVLLVLSLVFIYCGLFLAVVIPFGYVPWLHAIYAAIGAITFTMFLAFDTQLLMANKLYSLNPEEYIFAVLNIYLDIMYLFSFFLQLFGLQQD